MFEAMDGRVRAGPLGARSTGSFGNMLPKPAYRAHGFGYFRRNESSSLAAEASETLAKVHRTCERKRGFETRE